MNTNDMDMKDIWLNENKKLEEKMILNEKLLRSMTIDKAVTSFDKLLKLSILGRNLALVYCVISLVYSIRVFNEFIYSIPALLGAMAMLWSFFSHRSLKRVNFESSSVIDLQKSICAFRVHTDKMKLYDFSIVLFWLLTLTPAWSLSSLKLAIYDSSTTIIAFFALVTILIGVVYVVSKSMYDAYNEELKHAAQMLANLQKFDRTETV
jgi:Mn2+/Fe2+ NRAMP family transporter